jgi:hypothetical protein
MGIVLVGVFALAGGGVLLTSVIRYRTTKLSPWAQDHP